MSQKPNIMIVNQPSAEEIAYALMSKKIESVYFPENEVLIAGTKKAVVVTYSPKVKEKMWIHNHPVKIKDPTNIASFSPSIHDVLLSLDLGIKRMDIVFPFDEVVFSCPMKGTGVRLKLGRMIKTQDYLYTRAFYE